MTKRLDVVVAGPTPIGDVYGPPEELSDLVDVMRENGEPIPQEWLDLLEQWHENNDHLTVSRSVEFHLAGQHDQKTHGRRGGRAGTGQIREGTRGLAEPDSGMTVDPNSMTTITEGFAVAVLGSDRLILARSAFKNGEPSDALIDHTIDRIDAARTVDLPEGTRRALGAWHNPEDGKIEVNVTVVFPQSERDRAARFAVDNDQIAMADLAAIAHGDWPNAIIPTGGTGGDRTVDDPLAASGPDLSPDVRQ